MVRFLVLSLAVLTSLGCGVAGASFDYYEAGPITVGIFNNLTGAEVDGLVLRFGGPLSPQNALGIGGMMQLESNADGVLRYSGSIQPYGLWEVDWPTEGPRLEYAAWLVDGAVVEEIVVHNPTAAFSLTKQGKTVTFSATASADPDGLPLVRYLWQWSDGAEAEGRTVTRSFARGDYKVTLTVWDVEGQKGSQTATFTVTPGYTLTVNVVGNGQVDVAPRKHEYSYGDTVTLTPQVLPGDLLWWSFRRWEGDLGGTASPATITITGDTTINAVFVRRVIFSLEVVDYNDGACPTCGTVDVSGGLNVPATTGITFANLDYGTELTLEETPNTSEGWEFWGWDFNPWMATSGWNPTTFRVTDNMVVFVVFRRH